MRKGWLQYLSEDVYMRLCHCCTIKKDLQELVNAKWRAYQDAGKDKKGFTKEDALIAVLEHIECNGNDLGADLTVDEYNDLKKS